VEERAGIRNADPGDAPAIQAVYAPYVESSVASFEEVPPGTEEISRRMRSQPRLPWLVATRGGAVVGFAYASSHRARAAYRWSADCSVYLRKEERGRGTGRHLYERLLGELRSLGYVTVFAGIALPNAASVGLHEALGFRPVGTYRSVGYKHGDWRDVGWWQLPLVPPPVTPAEPRTWEP
jgi:phosphinothricin acetyltransferase